MKRFFMYTFISLAIFTMVNGESMANSPVRQEESVGANAPSFSVSNADGKTVSLEMLLSEKTAVVLNFWGLRCGACIEEIPHLNALYGKYGEWIEFLGVNVDAVDGAFLKEQMDKIGIVIEYEVIPDPEFSIADKYQLSAAPLTIVIDRNGLVRYRHENFEAGDEKKLEGVLESVLDGKKFVIK
ncbi:MAG: redoxin domain-containing protein [Deltaproteobacteria bacterium]|nr:redoxin domain-containing protein [Candidatus Latescibacterota bacterium]NIS77373.1 redoxin domain-containing protein [Deltaproteobacteria bacterium]